MGMKALVVRTINQRVFVEEIVRLAKLGAVWDDTKPVYKTGQMTAFFKIDEDVDVGNSVAVTVSYINNEDKKEPSEEVVEVEKKEEVKTPTPRKRAVKKTE